MVNRRTQKVGGSLVPQAPSKATVAQLGTNIATMKGKQKSVKQQGLMPGLSVGSRTPKFLQMFMDPVGAQPGLPPVSLPARVIPVKSYAECLLTTDTNGNCGLSVLPLMAGQYTPVATWSGTTIATYGTAQNNPEYSTFITNFQFLVPLCVEVVLKYTGSMTNVSGRMYGIVGNGYQSGDVTKYPLDPNGCEAVTSDGISCTWYSTEPVWSNPCGAGQTTTPIEWMDCGITCAMVGGPASLANCVSVGIYFHYAAVPKPAVCGLTPMAALPDPSMALVAGLMSASTSGVGASSASLKQRDKLRKRKAVIRDVLRLGGKAVGTFVPGAGVAVEVADMLANMLI